MPDLTNKQKMLAGETYNCLDEALEVERQRARELIRRFNRADEADEQRTLLEALLGAVPPSSLIEPPFYCSYGHNIILGEHVFINFQCTMVDCALVRIGNHVMLGPGVHIYTAAHLLQAELRNQGWEVAKPVTIEDNVWVGGGAILLPGVTVGYEAVVGAGSVVTHDVAPHTVVAGNPARPIRQLKADSP
jgi:maltose O-acetyltransferase